VKHSNKSIPGIELDKQEWLEAINDIRVHYGDEGVNEILDELRQWSYQSNIPPHHSQLNTPYLNSIPLDQQPTYPGDIELE